MTFLPPFTDIVGKKFTHLYSIGDSPTPTQSMLEPQPGVFCIPSYPILCPRAGKVVPKKLKPGTGRPKLIPGGSSQSLGGLIQALGGPVLTLGGLGHRF